MLTSYHLLIRSLAPCGPAPQLFADAVRRTVCGFVAATDYSRRATLLAAAPPGEAELARRMRTLLASDANPVPALLAGARSAPAFEACWNGLHHHWRVGIDTIVFRQDSGELGFERRARRLPGQGPESDHPLKHEVMRQCLLAVRQHTTARRSLHEVAQVLGLTRHAGSDMTLLLQDLPQANLSTAATHAGCRVRTLERQLATEGLRFTELRHATRLVEAGRLLRETSASITDIALATGFYDSAHFARSFRQATGLTARQYRALAQPLSAPAS